VVWTPATGIDAHNSFRTPSDRESTDIPVEEFACAMRFVLAQQVAMQSNELRKLTSAQMGFARMGGNLDDLLTQALELLQRQNVVEITDGKVKLA